MLDLLLMAIAFTIIFIIIVCFAIHVEKTNKFNNQLPTMMHRRIKIDKDFSDFEKKYNRLKNINRKDYRKEIYTFVNLPPFSLSSFTN